MVNVYLLPAEQGDFIWLNYGQEGDMHNIIIDGGTSAAADRVQELFEKLLDEGETIDAVFLSHIDNDHIGGLLNGMARVSEPERMQEQLGAIYMNTGRGIARELKLFPETSQLPPLVEESIEVESTDNLYGVGEAISWMKWIEKLQLQEKLVEYTVMGDLLQIGGACLHVISPGETNLKDLLLKKWEPYKQGKDFGGNYGADLPAFCSQNLTDLQKASFDGDSSINNRSSIAFIFAYEDVKLAFLGDAAPSVCVKGVKACGFGKQLAVDALKLAHHGSNHNTSDALLRALPTDVFMVCSNGENPTRAKNVPHKEALARLLKIRPGNLTLLCNYAWWDETFYGQYFTQGDKEDILDSGRLKVVAMTDEPYKMKEGLNIYGEWI